MGYPPGSLGSNIFYSLPKVEEKTLTQIGPPQPSSNPPREPLESHSSTLLQRVVSAERITDDQFLMAKCKSAKLQSKLCTGKEININQQQETINLKIKGKTKANQPQIPQVIQVLPYFAYILGSVFALAVLIKLISHYWS